MHYSLPSVFILLQSTILAHAAIPAGLGAAGRTTPHEVPETPDIPSVNSRPNDYPSYEDTPPRIGSDPPVYGGDTSSQNGKAEPLDATEVAKEIVDLVDAIVDAASGGDDDSSSSSSSRRTTSSIPTPTGAAPCFTVSSVFDRCASLVPDSNISHHLPPAEYTHCLCWKTMTYTPPATSAILTETIVHASRFPLDDYLSSCSVYASNRTDLRSYATAIRPTNASYYGGGVCTPHISSPTPTSSTSPAIITNPPTTGGAGSVSGSLRETKAETIWLASLVAGLLGIVSGLMVSL